MGSIVKSSRIVALPGPEPLFKVLRPEDAITVTDANSLLDTVAFDPATGIWTVDLVSNPAGGDLSDLPDAVVWEFPLFDVDGTRVTLDTNLFAPQFLLMLEPTIPNNTNVSVEMILAHEAQTVFTGGGVTMDNATGPAMRARSQASAAAVVGDASLYGVAVAPSLGPARWGDAECVSFDSSGGYINDVTRALSNGTGSNEDLSVCVTVGYSGNQASAQTVSFRALCVPFISREIARVIA